MINTTVRANFVQLLVANAKAVTTGTPLNIVSLFLNPGTYLVDGCVHFIPAASTSITNLQGGIGTITATLPTVDNGLIQESTAANVQILPNDLVLPGIVVSISGTAGATIFLNAQAAFTVSTLTASGYMTAVELSR